LALSVHEAKGPKQDSQNLGARIPKVLNRIAKIWEQEYAILFRPFGFLLLPDFGYPIEALWFSCSQILAILFRPFGILAPRFWLSSKGPKQDSQNLGARIPKGLNRIAKIWE
jgi:hypothetical protein